MDDIGQKSGHLMLITPERVFYAGLLGRPRQRCSGAFNIYASIEGGLWLTTADGRESYGDLHVLIAHDCLKMQNSTAHMFDRCGVHFPGLLRWF